MSKPLETKQYTSKWIMDLRESLKKIFKNALNWMKMKAQHIKNSGT